MRLYYKRVVIGDAGHYPWLERPVPFRRVLRSFLGELSAVE